jgi:hypothetical protein
MKQKEQWFNIGVENTGGLAYNAGDMVLNFDVQFSDKFIIDQLQSVLLFGNFLFTFNHANHVIILLENQFSSYSIPQVNINIGTALIGNADSAFWHFSNVNSPKEDIFFRCNNLTCIVFTQVAIPLGDVVGLNLRIRTVKDIS